MSLAMNIIPELWSNEIVAQLETNTVLMGLTNKMIASPLASKGDKMYIIGAADVSTGAYTDTADITYATPTDSSLATLSLDQDFYGALEIRDSEAKQANVQWQQLYAARIGYKLGLDFEGYLAGLHGSLTNFYETGSTDWQWGTDAADVPKFFAALEKAFADADADSLPGRKYVVLPTIGIQGIQLYLSGKATNLGDMTMVDGLKGKAGYKGTIGGFDVYVSTQLKTVSTTIHGVAGVAGDGWASARAIEPTLEVLRLEGGFKSGIRARHLFGAAVYRSAIMFDVNLNTSLLA
jgi:hypothetical protein